MTAYLKALARPEDEVSWDRILLMRYRLCDADLRTLNAGEDSLVDTFREMPLDGFEEPDRVAEAREHVTKLLAIRDSASLSYSYTSLAAYEDCPRSHYLDYVVNAFHDYQDTTSKTRDGVSQRKIGLLFHDTAEQAANQAVERREEWYEICERLASQRRAENALPAAKQCIDRYFELDLPSYELIDAEREFEIDIDAHELVGYIDAVYRTLIGELLVIEYKATERHRDLEDDKQLPIYLLACRDLYDEPVRRAGYAYVGDIGPTVESRPFSSADLAAVRDDVTALMTRIAEFSFGQYTAGDHCQWCQHNQLACAPDSFTVGPGFED